MGRICLRFFFSFDLIFRGKHLSIRHQLPVPGELLFNSCPLKRFPIISIVFHSILLMALFYAFLAVLDRDAHPLLAVFLLIFLGVVVVMFVRSFLNVLKRN